MWQKIMYILLYIIVIHAQITFYLSRYFKLFFQAEIGVLGVINLKTWIMIYFKKKIHAESIIVRLSDLTERFKLVRTLGQCRQISDLWFLKGSQHYGCGWLILMFIWKVIFKLFCIFSKLEKHVLSWVSKPNYSKSTLHTSV